MKKVVISLLICVLALGTMGVAFANNLSYSNSENDGVIASGFEALDNTKCTSVRFSGVDNGVITNFFGTFPSQAVVQYAHVKFNKNLKAGAIIEVDVTDGMGVYAWNLISSGSTTTGVNRLAGYEFTVPLDTSIYWNSDILDATHINVTVVGGTFP